MTIVQASKRERQENCCIFEVSLIYMVSFRPDMSIQQVPISEIIKQDKVQLQTNVTTPKLRKSTGNQDLRVRGSSPCKQVSLV